MAGRGCGFIIRRGKARGKCQRLQNLEGRLAFVWEFSQTWGKNFYNSLPQAHRSRAHSHSSI